MIKNISKQLIKMKDNDRFISQSNYIRNKKVKHFYGKNSRTTINNLLTFQYY